MIKIGITGQNGFIGSHLYNTLGLYPSQFIRIDFKKEYFENSKELEKFVLQCDVIVHLAAKNRHNDSKVIYETNIQLVKKLISSLKNTKHSPHVILSSSTQEELQNIYGKSKKEGRELLATWAEGVSANFTGLVIPNVFGPFGNPYYNSVVATFCHQLTHGEKPEIHVDSELQLIYVKELVDEIIECINNKIHSSFYKIQATVNEKVSDLLLKLKTYNKVYAENGKIPSLNTNFELNLFNTFRSYMDINNHFPVKFTKHTDDRGSFVEIIRLGVGGQVSFSTTMPGITRGNHYHTRKIERFAVIKGKALIQLRKIGTDEVLDFYLDGEEPAYVDMPIWYTHNIKNIGDDVLYTNFWINEFYNENDTDTYFEEV